jgi:Protein of unknown function (DUF2497)
MRQEPCVDNNSLNETLADIKGLIRQEDLAHMSADILELTCVVPDESNAALTQPHRKYKLYLDNEKENFIELDHDQMLSAAKEGLASHLQDWLNEHLPDIVRKEVKEQIQVLIHKESI